MMRIKIKDLARELGVTSRAVIECCREAGLPAQNSITKLDLHQAKKVRSLFLDRGDAATFTAPSDSVPTSEKRRKV